jgi:hypothetical protein
VPQTTYIHVHWYPPIPIAEVTPTGPAGHPGLYQVYGDHPVYGSKALLYIGKSERQTVADRVESDSWQLRDAQAEVHVGLIVNQEDLTAAERERLIGAAERLLILAHKPSQNAREFKNPPEPSGEHFHLLNWGARRSLLPEVSEAFWSKQFHDWEYPVL